MGERTIVAVYSDGGCIRANPSPIGGTWACVGVDADDLHVFEHSGVVRPTDLGGHPVTNNQMEFYALLVALESLPPRWSGRVCSDSQVTLGRFFGGQKMTGIPLRWVTRASTAIGRAGTLEPMQLSGHPTREQLRRGIGKRGTPVSIHNVWADRQCAVEAELLLHHAPRLAEQAREIARAAKGRATARAVAS